MQARGNKGYDITWKKGTAMELAFLLWEKEYISQSLNSSKSNNHRVMMKYGLLLASTGGTNFVYTFSLYMTLLNSTVKVQNLDHSTWPEIFLHSE